MRYLDDDLVDEIVMEVRRSIRSFFTDLKADRTMLEPSNFLYTLADVYSQTDAPVTNDNTQTPRIELRGERPGHVFGAVIVGVPVQFSDKYFGSYFNRNPKVRPLVRLVSWLEVTIDRRFTEPLLADCAMTWLSLV